GPVTYVLHGPYSCACLSYLCAALRALPSFPTRRSSDLFRPVRPRAPPAATTEVGRGGARGLRTDPHRRQRHRVPAGDTRSAVLDRRGVRVRALVLAQTVPRPHRFRGARPAQGRAAPSCGVAPAVRHVARGCRGVVRGAVLGRCGRAVSVGGGGRRDREAQPLLLRPTTRFPQKMLAGVERLRTGIPCTGAAGDGARQRRTVCAGG